MHEWESQERLLSDIEHQEVSNVLEYNDFRYQKHEWDNIPVIVPRYLIYLSKYIKGLSGFCYEVSLLESTESVRIDLDNKYKKDIQAQVSVDVNSLYLTPSTKLLEAKNFSNYTENSPLYSQKARQLTFNQIKDLFYIHLNRSSLCQQFIETQHLAKSCENNIKQLIVTDEALREYIDAKFDSLTARFNQFEELNHQQQNYNEQKQADLSNRLATHTEQISRLQDFQKDSLKFQEVVKVMNEKTNQKIDKEKENLTALMEQSEAELRRIINEHEKQTSQHFEQTVRKMEIEKVQMQELIAERERSILYKTNIYLAELRKYVEETANDLNQKRIEVQEKYEKKFNKVKEVITNYFEKYDVDLEELKINMKILNQKYADWSKILIEPTSLNEARLYALETRLHEEEEIRIKEYEYVRDLMKKLIFSLEQTNLQNLDIQRTTVKSQDRESISKGNQSQQQQLPNLLQTQTLSINKSQINSDKPTLTEMSLGLQHKTNEVLMLKRLNFLKTSLDGHSPRQTTTQMRLKSQKKRDERVVEIWRKEMESPTVQEILNQYLKTKDQISINLDDFSSDSQGQRQPSNKVRLAKLKSSIAGEEASRNSQFLSNQQEDSVIITKREGAIQLQPISTNHDTSASNIKTSNDSAFLTQKVQTMTKFNLTFNNLPNTKLNQSLIAVDQSVSQPNNLADKINKHKFLTNSDQKKINQDSSFKRGNSHLREPPIKDKLYDTFWSEFDNTMKERHLKQMQTLNERSKGQKIRGVTEERGKRQQLQELSKMNQSITEAYQERQQQSQDL